MKMTIMTVKLVTIQAWSLLDQMLANTVPLRQNPVFPRDRWGPQVEEVGVPQDLQIPPVSLVRSEKICVNMINCTCYHQIIRPKFLPSSLNDIFIVQDVHSNE